MPTQNSTQTYKMLKTYLDETADSFEKLDEEPGFLYRKTDGRTSLVFCARVDKELGFLLLSAYPGSRHGYLVTYAEITGGEKYTV